MDITLYHNPHCSKSRATLALIRGAGIEPRVIDYLQTPLDKDALRNLAARVGVPVRALLRDGEALYTELSLGDPALSDKQLLDVLAAHPRLLNRPIAITASGGRLCRPPELVLELLGDLYPSQNSTRHP